MGIEFGKRRLGKETGSVNLKETSIETPKKIAKEIAKDKEDLFNNLSQEAELEILMALEDSKRRKPQGVSPKLKEDPFRECKLPDTEGGSPSANLNLSAKQESDTSNNRTGKPDPINEGGIVPPPY